MDYLDGRADGSGPLANDLMIGASQIAKFLGIPERQVYYLKDTKALPIFNIGGKIAARKSGLKQRIEKLEQA
jgi:hypothetical protein